MFPSPGPRPRGPVTGFPRPPARRAVVKCTIKVGFPLLSADAARAACALTHTHARTFNQKLDGGARPGACPCALCRERDVMQRNLGRRPLPNTVGAERGRWSVRSWVDVASRASLVSAHGPHSGLGLGSRVRAWRPAPRAPRPRRHSAAHARSRRNRENWCLTGTAPLLTACRGALVAHTRRTNNPTTHEHCDAC